MNDREQLELENYLREFQPCSPKALPAASTTETWRRLAAAIALFFVGSLSIWAAWHSRSAQAPAASRLKDSSPTDSPILLTRLALEKPREFTSRMDRRSPHILQKFARPDSALRALAKE